MPKKNVARKTAKAKPRRKAASPAVEAKVDSYYEVDVDDVIQATNKTMNKVDLVGLGDAQHLASCLSTGSLQLDLDLGGGLPGGRMISFSGKDNSGKSTIVLSAMGLAAKQGIKSRLDEPEAGLDKRWASAIARLKEVELFGEKNDRDEYVTKPLIYLDRSNTGEDAFRYIIKHLRRLPVKAFNHATQQWELFEVTEASKKGGSASSKLLGVVKDAKPQFVYAIDSLASLLSEDDDEDKGSGGAMATEARMLSKAMRRVKVKLGNRHCVLLMVNQLRERPGVMYGSPEYEPGGNAVLFYPDIRVRMRAVSIPGGKGAIEEELAVTGRGQDKYRYSKYTIIRNRVRGESNGVTGYIRIWYSSCGAKGHGVDPVYDLRQYLKSTGQILQRAGRISLSLVKDPATGEVMEWFPKTLTYKEFKEIALSQYLSFDCLLDMAARHKMVPPGMKAGELAKLGKTGKLSSKQKRQLRKLFDLRGFCATQLASGDAFRLMANTVNDATSNAEGGDSSDE